MSAKTPKEPLQTFVADCLRIIRQRRLDEALERKEQELRKVMKTIS